MPASRLHLTMPSTVIHPSTGEELWVDRLLDVDSGRYCHVSVDESGQATHLPDWSERAVALIAEEEGISAEQLIVGNAIQVIYPFSHQLVWRAKLSERRGYGTFAVDLDLCGYPVDIEAVQAAEQEAHRAQCPKLQDALCYALLHMSPDAVEDVEIATREGLDPKELVAHLDRAGYEARQGRPFVYARLPKSVILDLVALDMVAWIDRGPHDGTVPLDSNLSFAFEEMSGQITLKMRTMKEYGCSNFPIEAALSRPESRKLELVIEGVHWPIICKESQGPARLEVNLGYLNGVYELAFAYEGLRDRYQMGVSPERIALEPVETTFTWPEYDVWLRLPPDTVWFVTRARTVHAGGTPVVLDRSTYQAQVGAFFADVEKLGAVRFVPEEGVYSNRGFISPWPSWWGSRGGYTEIHRDDRSFHSLEWPEIRYYRYAGTNESIRELVEAHRSNTLGIVACTWEEGALEW